MPPARPSRTSLDEALESAAELSRRALADYRMGVIDEGELRTLLYHTGLVQWPDEAWLLDLEAGRWWRYDGVVLRDGGDTPTAPVARLRDVVDELVDGLIGGDGEAGQ